MLNLNSKVLENRVCDSIDNHTADMGLIHPNQWAFQKGISTESLLLFLTETWKKAIDDGFKVGVLFVDFKKAFNRINHDVLKAKLQAAGISGAFHDWLSSYLSNRRQFVAINGVNSHTKSVEVWGAPGIVARPKALYIVHQ